MPNLNQFFSLVKLAFRAIGGRATLWLVVASVTSLGLTAVEIAIAGILQLFLKAIGLIGSDVAGFTLLDGFNPSRVDLGIMLAIIAIIRAAGNLIIVKGTVTSGQIFNGRLRLLALHEMLLKENAVYVSVAKVNLRVGELFVRASEFISQFNKAMCAGIQAVGVFIFLLYMEWRLALIGLLGVALIGGFALFVFRRVATLAKDLPVQQGKLLSGIERVSRNWLLVRVLRTGQREFDILAESTIRYAGHSIRGQLYATATGIVPPLLGMFLVVSLVTIDVEQIGIPPLNLVTFLYMFLRLLQFLGNGFRFAGSVVTGTPHFLMVLDFFAEQESAESCKHLGITNRIRGLGEIEKAERSQPLPRAAETIDSTDAKLPNIVIDQVDFQYVPTGKKIIDCVTLEIKEGIQFGIVGKSGSGKSTLLALILGVLKPDKGTITISSVPPEEYITRKNVSIGYVGAEPFLIEGSIRENMAYGLSRKKETNDFLEALRDAELTDVIMSKPGGLEYRINENGDGLSAGQKQRLSLARALLAQPNLLVMDEASANIDVATELELAGTIRKLKGKATVIIVSHREGMLSFVDEVYDFSTSSTRRS